MNTTLAAGEESQIQLNRIEGNNTVYILSLTGKPHKANVFTIPLLRRLDSLLDEVEDNLPCSLVICGNGKFFSAGFDLKALTGTSHQKSSTGEKKQQQVQRKQGTQVTPQGQELGQTSLRLLARLLVFPAPTIAVFNGHAFGLGLFLGLACDHRVMITEDGKSSGPGRNNHRLCLPEISIGLPLGSGLAALAKCKMNASTLRTAALTGKQYNCHEALEAGIVDQVLRYNSTSLKDGRALPEEVLTMAESLVSTSEKGNLRAIKFELYGDTHSVMTGAHHRSKL